MKTIQNISKALFINLMFVIVVINTVSAQTDKKTAKEEAIQKMIDSRNYTFKAESALPMNGLSRQLTSEYDLKVSGDTVISYLPYFGRAYTAPIDPSQGPINFTSTNFEYITEKGKKDRWEILIKPKDARDIQQLSLSISTGGYATLQVLSNNRQPISFNGHIEERKQKSR